MIKSNNTTFAGVFGGGWFILWPLANGFTKSGSILLYENSLSSEFYYNLNKSY